MMCIIKYKELVESPLQDKAKLHGPQDHGYAHYSVLHAMQLLYIMLKKMLASMMPSCVLQHTGRFNLRNIASGN